MNLEADTLKVYSRLVRGIKIEKISRRENYEAKEKIFSPRFGERLKGKELKVYFDAKFYKPFLYYSSLAESTKFAENKLYFA